MIQLGCCDFNLHHNLQKYTNVENNTLKDELKDKILTIYSPSKIALGAYGNIYNLGFAKMILEEKNKNFLEFDTNFDTYYEKYKIGICYPNLITSELSTTNLRHNFSLFDKCKNYKYVKQCFVDFNYSDYNFMWILFLKYCYNNYISNKSLDKYEKLIEDFSHNYPKIKNNITNVLLNNNYNINDIQEIMVLLENDKYII